MGERTRAKWQGFWALIGALVGAGVLAAAALAFVTIYKNNFDSKPDLQGGRPGRRRPARPATAAGTRSGRSCGSSSARRPARASTSRRSRATRPQPDHRFDADGRVLKKTADNIRDDAYLSIAVRVGGGKRYELRVFPKEQGLPASPPARRRRLPDQRHQPGDRQDRQQNQHAPARRGEPGSARSSTAPRSPTSSTPTPSELTGAKVEFGVGNNDDSKKNTVATFDKLKLAVPDP